MGTGNAAAEGAEVGWLVALCKCRVCGKEHVSVYPEDIWEEENQECPTCHAMAAEPMEDGD